MLHISLVTCYILFIFWLSNVWEVSFRTLHIHIRTKYNSLQMNQAMKPMIHNRKKVPPPKVSVSDLSPVSHTKMKSGLPMGSTCAAHGCPLKQWAAQWTGAAHYLCKLIIISAHGLHMGSSVGRSCPIAFKIFIISDHGLPKGSSDC